MEFEDELAAAFADALQTGEIPSNVVLSQSAGAGPSKPSRAREDAQGIPLRKHYRDLPAIGHQIYKDARSENIARKKRRHQHKTTCAYCSKNAEKGAKLAMCSRCRAANYCSAVCQKLHYSKGHKEDCINFVDPPFAKLFNPSDRNDVPWPVNPVIGSDHSKGIGIWISPDIGMDEYLAHAWQPPDLRVDAFGAGPPSFRRWAGFRGRHPPNLDTSRQYLGPTLCGLRMLVQNRRTDGKVVLIQLEKQAILARELFEEFMFPEQKVGLQHVTLPVANINIIVVDPWVDYNKEARYTILEINSVPSPVGSFGPNWNENSSNPLPEPTEYQPPQMPATAPWDRVMDKGWLALGVGDFAVIACQYRLGDGHLLESYPEVMMRTTGALFRAVLLDTKSTEPGWVAKAKAEWDDPVRMKQKKAKYDEHTIQSILSWDFTFMSEYFQPFFDDGPDAFAEKRLGSRAKHRKDMMDVAGPMTLHTVLSGIDSLPPGRRAQIEQDFAAMGRPLDGFREMLRDNPPPPPRSRRGRR